MAVHITTGLKSITHQMVSGTAFSVIADDWAGTWRVTISAGATAGSANPVYYTLGTAALTAPAVDTPVLAQALPAQLTGPAQFVIKVPPGGVGNQINLIQTDTNPCKVIVEVL